jgi:hypothetical protein
MTSETTEVEMEIFRAGDYGAKGRYSEADLRMLAEDYRPELLEAPLTFDHAQSGPAYGWVTGLRASGDRLLAVLRGVPEAVRQLVRSGAFQSRSVELIRNLQETGRPYLRAVSLLGAATPEVKGLGQIKFSAAADTDHELVEFADAPEEPEDTSALLLRNGEELPCEVRAAEPKLEFEPGWNEDCGNETPQNLADDCEAPRAESTLEDAHGAALVELAALRAQIAALERELQSNAADALVAELRADGYALPDRHATGLRQFAAAAGGQVIRFSETEAAPAMDWLREFLRSTAPRVPIGVAGVSSAPGEPAYLQDVPMTERTDPASIDLHRRAIALMQQDGSLPYSAALARAAG